MTTLTDVEISYSTRRKCYTDETRSTDDCGEALSDSQRELNYRAMDEFDLNPGSHQRHGWNVTNIPRVLACWCNWSQGSPEISCSFRAPTRFPPVSLAVLTPPGAPVALLRLSNHRKNRVAGQSLRVHRYSERKKSQSTSLQEARQDVQAQKETLTTNSTVSVWAPVLG